MILQVSLDGGDSFSRIHTAYIGEDSSILNGTLCTNEMFGEPLDSHEPVIFHVISETLWKKVAYVLGSKLPLFPYARG